MLSDVLDVLSDPIDGSSLHDGGNLATLVSDTGHSYDVARQGYVSLVGGRGLRYKGDDASMIQAREKFLASGHFGP
ncbi:MAG: SAM-dependent methyltransferase, partial [Corynebacterium kroppenstedtii]|nr:SAM-dependent methyltransferase [Corynebacterium kroppenstedtii]